MKLTKDYLIAHGWRDAFPNVFKDFTDFKGDKYRIGWNYETKVLYMGYGQAPILVQTLADLLAILDAFKFIEEVCKLPFEKY